MGSLRASIVALMLGACATPTRRPPRPPASVPAPRTPPLNVVDVIGAEWPRVVPGLESRYFSSFDRTGRNADGFNGRYSTLYRLPSGEHVIFDALGPGVLRTLWFTGPEEGGAGLELGLLRFYFDDEPEPRITIEQRQLFEGRNPPFVAPLVADNRVSTGGYASWVPLAYRRRMVVTTQKRPSFFIAQYDTYPPRTALSSWRPGADLDGIRGVFSRALRGLSDRPLTAVPLDHRHAGAGTLEVVRFHPTRRPDREALARARVRIWWDGRSTPAVDAPLGMFFGSGLGEAPVRAAAFAMARGTYENRLPMPFWRGFRIQISGIDGELRLGIGQPRFRPAEAGQLHAVYHAEPETRPGHDFEWIDLKGSGKLVGTVLTIIPPTPETKRWWEGDLRSYADGRRTPGLHGTGHEDDHLGGWSNTFLSRPFSLPMQGEPASELIEREGEQYNARTTLYRLWPGIAFSGSIRHGVEHGSENRVQASYAGLAFVYLQPGGPRLHEVDRLDLGDAASRAGHGYRAEGESRAALTSAFEGRGYRDPLTDEVTRHTGAARFTLRATPDNDGCWLRRLYDQEQGRQRARVRVGGNEVGEWYTAEANATLRWAERGLFLPASVTRARRSLQVEIVPAAAPAWSAAEYRLLCVRRYR